MNKFLLENNFGYLSNLLKAHGITESNFFTMGQSFINTLLKENSVIDKFSKAFYNAKSEAEKTVSVEANNSPDPAPIIDNNSINPTEEAEENVIGVSFEVVENELIQFLRTSEIGAGVIGIYKRTGNLKERLLRDLIIVNELKKDLKNCKIFQERFIKLRELIVEAFPSQRELALTWYEPSQKCKNKQKKSLIKTAEKRQSALGNRGLLYTSYKHWRKFFRESGQSESCKDSDDDRDSDAGNDSNSGLLQSDYILEINKKTDPPEIIKCWDQHYQSRQSALKQVTSVDVYLSSLTCLSSPMGPLLLQSDFNKLYKHKDPENKFYNIIEVQWPSLSKELLDIFINSRKSRPEVDKFLKQFDDRLPIIIENDLTNQIVTLSLLLLPIFLKHKPNIFTSGVQDVITKSNLLDSFILVVEDPDESEIDKRIGELEKFYTDHQLALPLPPLVILWGTIEDTRKCYVLINNYKHQFSNILQAVQFCFISYKALSLEFPELCKPAWSFIQRRIFKIQLSRGISCIDDLVKRLGTSNKRKLQSSSKDSDKKKKKT